MGHLNASKGGAALLRSDEAPALAGAEGFREEKVDKSDCAAKLNGTVTARAALIGIEVHQLDGGDWLLRHARGASIGTVRSMDALDAALGGFEAAQRDVRELVQRMRGAA